MIHGVARKDFSAATSRLKASSEQQRGAAGRASAHIQSVQEQLEAIERGDLDAVLSHAADSVTLDIFAPPEFEWVRHARGAEELRKAIEQNFSAVDEQKPIVTNVIAQGDSVVVFGREHGLIRTSRQPYDIEFVQRYTFKEGRLVSVSIIAAHAV